MNPQTETGPGLHLPSPTSGGDVTHSPEVSATEFAPAPMQAPPLQTTPPVNLGQPITPTTAQPVQDDDAAAVQVDLPAADSESDKLDKEWVAKAKNIVDQTKDDPFSQSNALGQVKADYLKIRYNKFIKVKQPQS